MPRAEARRISTGELLVLVAQLATLRAQPRRWGSPEVTEGLLSICEAVVPELIERQRGGGEY